ncbi:MAG: nitroreductase [Pseudomonadota bacterium]
MTDLSNAPPESPALTPPPAPNLGDQLTTTQPSGEALKILVQRRSTPIKLMGGPGPNAEEVDALLRVAARAPDHRRVEPWRFIVLEGDARVKFGAHLADAWRAANPDADEDALQVERNRLLRAPVCVIVVSSPDMTHKTPVWEQELSVGAVCMNMLTAAYAMGWAAAWISEWCAFDPNVDKALGLTTDERIAGFMYLGSAPGPVPERPRPDMTSKIARWTPSPSS